MATRRPPGVVVGTSPPLKALVDQDQRVVITTMILTIVTLTIKITIVLTLITVVTVTTAIIIVMVTAISTVKQ